MATHTTNKILLEFDVEPEKTMTSVASVLVPVLEGAFANGTVFTPVCQELASERVRTFSPLLFYIYYIILPDNYTDIVESGQRYHRCLSTAPKQ